jgi:hypothetical protein
MVKFQTNFCKKLKRLLFMFQSENLMLEAFGTCLPTNRAGELFLQSYMDRKDPN